LGYNNSRNTFSNGNEEKYPDLPRIKVGDTVKRQVSHLAGGLDNRKEKCIQLKKTISCKNMAGNLKKRCLTENQY